MMTRRGQPISTIKQRFESVNLKCWVYMESAIVQPHISFN